MNKLISHNTLLRENIVFLIGACLLIYFSYHAVLGNRSLVKDYSLNKQIETLSQKASDLRGEKEQLEKKVVMMRPSSINKDLLEEQVRLTLGYRAKNEIVILDNKS